MSTPEEPRKSRWMLTLTVLAAVVLLGGIGLTAGGATELGRYEFVRVPGQSMLDTIPADAMVAIRKAGSLPVQRGDIVLFTEPSWWPGGGQATLVKRVIGIAGDRVACCDLEGGIRVDGQPVTETYLHQNAAMAATETHPFTATVPAGTVFVAGDFRGDSLDSRFLTDSPTHGAIPLSLVTGRVVAVDTGGGPQVLPLTDAFEFLGPVSEPDNGYATGAVLLIVGFAVTAVGLAALLSLGVLALVRRSRRRSKPIALA